MKSRILVSLFLLISCRAAEKKFDSQVWRAIDGSNFSQQREPIVSDLVTNHLSRGMSYKQLTDLLGEPEIGAGDAEIGYIVSIRFGWGIGIDPVEGKDLLIRLAEDSTVVDYRIKEWEK